MVDFTTKTDDEIDSWIANHERHKKTDSDLYRNLILERDRRFGRGLNINVSMRAMIDAAKAGRFISYGEIAEANGVVWSKARHLMNGKHGDLDNLLAHCNAQGLPLFTAIVIQKGKLNTGEMDDFTLAGFVEGAQRIGRNVTDAKSFLKQCQGECFAWMEPIQVFMIANQTRWPPRWAAMERLEEIRITTSAENQRPSRFNKT